VSKRDPEVFQSDLHLPRWRRVLLWVLESAPGRSMLSLTLALVIGLPLLFLGWWWAAVVVGTALGFVAGYWVARSYWLAGEDIPKL
jgi:putative flippase GtrA